jgi:hypothetical protein
MIDRIGANPFVCGHSHNSYFFAANKNNLRLHKNYSKAYNRINCGRLKSASISEDIFIDQCDGLFATSKIERRGIIAKEIL